MQFLFNHTNLNVTDLDKSIAFYKEALGLETVRVIEGGDGAFRLAFLTDGVTGYQLELTWLKDHPQKYDLGENETHICFRTEDIEAARKKHEEMGCVCYVNDQMGLYFIEDPDGYWFEITPVR
ncbi:MAG: VOC family protein [Christensenellales bacterium]|jgi:lactoylglutathione lyase